MTAPGVSPGRADTDWRIPTGLVDIAPMASTVPLVGRIHVDLLRVCTAACPGR